MNCQCTKGGQCDCGMCADLSRQDRAFDVESEPMDWLDLFQVAARWLVALCVGGFVGAAAGWWK